MRDNSIIFKKIKLPLKVIANFFHLSAIQVSNTLLQVLLFPIIIHIIGFGEFGHVMVANSFAGLMGIFINYGTNQSGIKDITLQRESAQAKSAIFFSVLYARIILFIIALAILAILYYLHVPQVLYYLFAVTLIFSEVLNPLFFFIGIEKLLFFNLVNICSKLLSILAIITLVKHPGDAPHVNLYLGISATLSYIALIVYAVRRHALVFLLPGTGMVFKLLKENFSLVFNGLSIHLQQSFFLFQLSFVASPIVLSAYSLCDKIVWSCRLFTSSLSSAVYPKTTLLYEEDPRKWNAYKIKLNRLLFMVLAAGGACLFLFPRFFIHILTGANNVIFEHFLQMVAFVPLVIAMNAFNVIDLLLKNAYRLIFKISIIILCVSLGLSFLLTDMNRDVLFGYYPLLIESAALLIYTIAIRRSAAVK